MVAALGAVNAVGARSGVARVSVMLPVFVPSGSTKIAYVPLDGKVTLMAPPLVVTEVDVRSVPLGL